MRAPTEQLWATTSPFYIKELDSRYPYDPAKARALIAEAGFKDGVDITLLLLNTTEYRQLAEALARPVGRGRRAAEVRCDRCVAV